VIESRTQFAPMLGSCGASFVDPRGKLLGRTHDILGDVDSSYCFIGSQGPKFNLLDLIFAGLYSTFVFQKPDPDAIPPIVTPDLHDADNTHEEVCFATFVDLVLISVLSGKCWANTLIWTTGMAPEAAGTNR
jgi:hypothetical protein